MVSEEVVVGGELRYLSWAFGLALSCVLWCSWAF